MLDVGRCWHFCGFRIAALCVLPEVLESVDGLWSVDRKPKGLKRERARTRLWLSSRDRIGESRTR